MKKLVMWLGLIGLPAMSFAQAVPVPAAPVVTAPTNWHGFSLPNFKSAIPLSTLGGWAFINKQAKQGQGLDLVYYQIPGTLNGKPLPQLYLALDEWQNGSDLFTNPGHMATIWGPGIGTSIGGLGTIVQTSLLTVLNLPAKLGLPIPLIPNLPASITNAIDKYVSVEVSGGPIVGGNEAGLNHCAIFGGLPCDFIVGGKVNVPISFSVGK